MVPVRDEKGESHANDRSRYNRENMVSVHDEESIVEIDSRNNGQKEDARQRHSLLQCRDPLKMGT